MGTPLVGSGFEAWKLPEGKASALEHDWAVRVRLGPLAKVSLPQTPPPAPKRVLSWGGSSAPASAWAVWLPSARQIRRIPLLRHRHCEAGKAILVRSESRTSRGRGAGETDVPQQAKVGYCPCCTVPTHVTGLPAREAGVLGPLEARGVALSAQFGPWEGRRFAAFRCSEFFGRLTKEWDWAASRVALATNPASLPARRDPVTTNERKKGKKRRPHMRVRGKAPHSRDGIRIRFLRLARNFLRAAFPPAARWFSMQSGPHREMDGGENPQAKTERKQEIFGTSLWSLRDSAGFLKNRLVPKKRRKKLFVCGGLPFLYRISVLGSSGYFGSERFLSRCSFLSRNCANLELK